jgi:hypothetical protein
MSDRNKEFWVNLKKPSFLMSNDVYFTLNILTLNKYYE